MGQEKVIVAVSTPPGSGGIAVIRMSGKDVSEILSKAWTGKNPSRFESHTAHLGWIKDVDDTEIDQVVAVCFKAPNSYTGEDVIEISCHGSPWIQQAIVNRLIECGAKAAGAGEFTRRAFVNGRLDLVQAEGVADMISASSKAAARLAISQLKGEFSSKLKTLRDRLVDIGSLLELELDFSEEDVEFADRKELIALAKEIRGLVSRLSESFKAGRAFKGGIPVAIAGVPNAGKSTLLNVLVEEDKAIVSDIEGTTRDIIEDTAEIGGLLFRFYDTAGLRKSEDAVESIGIERARKKISESSIVLKLYDPTKPFDVQNKSMELDVAPYTRVINLVTKGDLNIPVSGDLKNMVEVGDAIVISSDTGFGIDTLKKKLVEMATADFNPEQELVVTNARHYEALRNSMEPLDRLVNGLETGISGDFLAQDLRETEHYLGEITGAVTSTDILHTIFARYCIGK